MERIKNMAATAKVIELKGDPRKPESAEHIIMFPGGSISVCRTSNNEYWAHIEVNHHEIIEDTIRQSKIGKIVKTRLDYFRPPGEVKEIEDIKDLTHLAVRISIE
jgi:hypothetical protein